MERSRFIDHKGKKIYVIDCSNCKPADIHPLIDECARVVRSQPPKSVLTMTVAGGGKFDNDIVAKLKELTKGNEPYVKQAAVVGMSGLYKVVLMAVAMFSKREFHMFDTEEEAKDFLVNY
ncbi:MAG: hypothetical protein C0624_09000 [Desulfuromonas sp.]|nr:MAG: hypothetical protein C0624_09000 [Desulfuromonas sp.]